MILNRHPEFFLPSFQNLLDEAKSAFPFLVLLTFLSILFVGYQYGNGDSGYYLMHIRHRMDPSFLANDWYLSQAWEPHIFFVWFMSKIATWPNLPFIFLALHILERFVTLLGMFLLSFLLFRNLMVSYLALFVLILTIGEVGWPLGDSQLFCTSTIPHTLGLMLSLYALIAFLSEKRHLAALILGITTDIHLLIGLNLALVFFGYWWLNRKGSFRNTILIPSTLYLTLASGTLIPTALNQFCSITNSPISAATYINILGYFLAPWHYIASSWPLSTILIFFIYLQWGLLAVQYTPAINLHRKVIFLSSSFLILAVLGIIFVEYIPSSLILKFQFFRLLIFIKLFVSIYLANFIGVELQNKERLRQLISIVLLLNVRNPAFLALMGFFVSWRKWKAMKSPLHLIQIAGFLGSLLGFIWVQRLTLLSRAPIILPRIPFIAIAGLLIYGLLHASKRPLHVRFQTLIASRTLPCMAVLLPCLLVAGKAFGLQRFSPYLNPHALFQRIQVTFNEKSDQTDLYEWIRNNTPRDSTFIVPLQLADFRLRAERAIVIDFNHLGGFREEQIFAGWQRIQRFIQEASPPHLRGNTEEYFRQRYAKLKEEDFLTIARDYEAFWVVCPSDMFLNFPMVYSDTHFRVYKIQG